MTATLNFLRRLYTARALLPVCRGVLCGGVKINNDVLDAASLLFSLVRGILAFTLRI